MEPTPREAELLALLQERDERIARQDKEIALLHQKVDALVRKIFGSSSEPFNPNQLDLFGANSPQVGEEPGKVCASCSGEAPRQKSKRREPSFPEDAPVEEIIIEPLEVQAEPEAYQCIGEEVSVQHDFTPGNRPEDALDVWRDYNPRATIEQRIEEIKNDLNAAGFCTQAFFATEAAFLAVLFAYNLLALYQGQVTASCGYRKPSTLRAAVFVGGAILGRCGRNTLLRFSQAWGGLHKHNPLIDASLHPKKPIAPLLPRSPVLSKNYQKWTANPCPI